MVGSRSLSALTLLPAILAIVGTRIDRLAVRRVTAEPGADGPWARLARRVMRHPVAVLVPTLSLLLAPRRPVPARPVQRPGLDDPAALGPVARGLRHPRPRVRRGRVRAARARDPHDRRRHRARTTSRSSTTTRAGSRPTRGSAASSSLVDVDPRLTLAQYQLLYGAPGGPPDRFVATALAATTKGDLTAFTVYTPLRPEPRRGRARSSTSCATRPARSRRRAGVTVLVGGGAADVDDVVSPRVVGLPADGAVHRRDDLPRAVRPPPVGGAADQGAGHEHALDRGQLRRPRLDLPGRQPVGGCSGSSRSASSRPPSR